MRNFIRLSAVLAAGTMLAAGSAYADTDTMTVSGEVTAVCDVIATNISFADTPSNIATDWDLAPTAALSVTCTNDAGYSIGIDEGANQSAATENRRMANGTEYLPYTLYKDNFVTDVAPDFAPNNYSGTEVGTGSAQSFDLAARVAQADVNAAKALEYTDTIEVTITLN